MTPTITLRCGTQLVYESPSPVPAAFLVAPRHEPSLRVRGEHLSFDPQPPPPEEADSHGNRVHRLTLSEGRTTVRHDLLADVPAVTEDLARVDDVHPVADLPLAALRYVMPSRYCDADRLADFAWQTFGHLPRNLSLVQNICDWVHANIEYRWGAGSPFTSASEVVAQRYGVCRDFAHVALTLCRCCNIPARYVTGYLPDVGVYDPGSPMDFHAYFQVYAGHKWQTFDARFNVPRIGRIHVAAGLDAVDAAFSTLFGPAKLTYFEVFSYQVNPAEVGLGDPVDMSKRLCGTPTVRTLESP